MLVLVNGVCVFGDKKVGLIFFFCFVNYLYMVMNCWWRIVECEYGYSCEVGIIIGFNI